MAPFLTVGAIAAAAAAGVAIGYYGILCLIFREDIGYDWDL